MKNLDQQNKFYEWLKERTTFVPSMRLDDKILSHAEVELKTKSQNKTVWWAVITTTVLASLIIYVEINHNKNDQVAVDESFEMILNYNNLELMAEAGNLTDAEWKKLEQ